MDNDGSFYMIAKTNCSISINTLVKLKTFPSLLQSKNTSFLKVSFIGLVIIVGLVCLTSIDYKKYRKTNYLKNKDQNRSFGEYIKNKKLFSHKKDEIPKLSEETLELMDEILKENNIEK